MTAALADDLRTYALKRWPTMNHEWRKARLASLLGMKVRRVRSYWDAEETLSPRQSEVDAIKALIGQEEVDDATVKTRIAELEAQVAFLIEALAFDQMAAARNASRGEMPAPARSGRTPSVGRSADRT